MLAMAIAKERLAGPRILTAVEPLTGRGPQTGTPDEIRAYVRKQKEAGADLIKIYASGGMTRGAMTLSQEQLNADWRWGASWRKCERERTNLQCTSFRLEMV
jgi:hypothetical protein